jgi:hypothetical protein
MAGPPDSEALALVPEWSALSMVAFFAGSATSANLLEQRYVEPQALRPAPGGTYEAGSSFPAFGQRAFTFAPTLVELSLDFGFPDGEFVDDLFGWAFFLGNSSERAKRTAAARGNRLNFTQHTYALPAGDHDRLDTRPARRFIELFQARLHAADLRPLAIDFLYIPADRFLLSASRGLSSFAITLSFADRNRARYAPDLHALLLQLGHDCRTLGGRIHLVKNVVADHADLRAMYGDVAAELRRRKAHFDPRGLFRNEFFERVFGA